MKKFFVGILTILVVLLFFVLQINLFNYFQLFGVIPNIGIILVVVISICAGKNIGAITGLAYGVLFDSCFETSFGLYTALFGIIGYLVGFLKGKLALDNKASLFIMIALSTIIIEFMSVIVLSMKNPNFVGNNLYIIKVIVLEVLYNIFLSFIAYKPLMLLGDIINRSRRAYYDL